MLAAHGPLGHVSADGHQAEQRVEVEMPERADVGADPQIALDEGAADRERGEQREGREQPRRQRAPGVDPEESRERDDDAGDGARDLGAERGASPQQVRGVRPPGHVGGGAALEVAVPEPGDLGEEGDAETHLEAAPRPEHAVGEGELEPQHQEQVEHERAGGAEPQPGQRQLPADLEQAAEQQRLEDHAARGDHDAGREDARRQQAVLAQEAPQRAPGLVRRLRQRRRELGGERRRRRRSRGGCGSRRGLAPPADGDKHRTAEQDLRFVVLARRRGGPGVSPGVSEGSGAGDPVARRDRLLLAGRHAARPLQQGVDEPRGLPPA